MFNCLALLGGRGGSFPLRMSAEWAIRAISLPDDLLDERLRGGYPLRGRRAQRLPVAVHSARSWASSYWHMIPVWGGTEFARAADRVAPTSPRMMRFSRLPTRRQRGIPFWTVMDPPRRSLISRDCRDGLVPRRLMCQLGQLQRNPKCMQARSIGTAQWAALMATTHALSPGQQWQRFGHAYSSWRWSLRSPL